MWRWSEILTAMGGDNVPQRELGHSDHRVVVIVWGGSEALSCIVLRPTGALLKARKYLESSHFWA